MARKRKAVDNGKTRTQPTRRCSSTAKTADPKDVGESHVAMSSSKNKQPKRNPKRAAKDPWAEDKLMTSTSSNLIYLDLVKLLAKPEAWNCLEESEKREILDLLPEDLYSNLDPSPDDPGAKIPPLPEEFLRYSNNWRDGIRHFQLDLQNGRYDPVWLRQAGEAMQQRADGKFDKFKEEEFEQFWGQKQKMDKRLAAGQSSQVKLSTLISNGVVLVGDVWKYSRAFKKGNLLVEKEARIVDIQDGRLTFELPLGQRVFLPAPQSSPLKDPQVLVIGEIEKSEVVTTTTAEIEQDRAVEISAGTYLDTNLTEEAGSSNKRKSEIQMEPRKRGRGRRHQVQTPEDVEVDQVIASTEVTRPTQVTVEVTNPPPTVANMNPSVMIQTTTTEHDDQNLEIVSEQPSATVDDALPRLPIVEGTSEEPGIITVSGITGPNAIAMKILEVDGRSGKVPSGNAWKDFRAYRNNQDMGSLWEVRQAWFLRNKSLVN